MSSRIEAGLDSRASRRDISVRFTIRVGEIHATKIVRVLVSTRPHPLQLIGQTCLEHRLHLTLSNFGAKERGSGKDGNSVSEEATFPISHLDGKCIS